jgi:hypothetical protein
MTMNDEQEKRYVLVIGSDGWSIWDRVTSRQTPDSIRLLRIEAELLCEYLNSSTCAHGERVVQDEKSGLRYGH